jgi:hypothetical protein
MNCEHDVTDAIDPHTAEIADDFRDHFAAEIAELALLYVLEPYEKVGAGLAALRRALAVDLDEEVLDALVYAVLERKAQIGQSATLRGTTLQ